VSIAGAAKHDEPNLNAMSRLVRYSIWIWRLCFRYESEKGIAKARATICTQFGSFLTEYFQQQPRVVSPTERFYPDEQGQTMSPPHSCPRGSPILFVRNLKYIATINESVHRDPGI
jgi:hypothetical protein